MKSFKQYLLETKEEQLDVQNDDKNKEIEQQKDDEKKEDQKEKTFAYFLENKKNKDDISKEFKDSLKNGTSFSIKNLFNNIIEFFINNENNFEIPDEIKNENIDIDKLNFEDLAEEFINNKKNNDLLSQIPNSTSKNNQEENLLDTKPVEIIAQWFLIYKFQQKNKII